MSAQTHCCARSNHFTPPEDRWLYRERTIGLLRKYFQMAIEIVRLPALLGREVFRSKITSYKRSSFEDSVIFVHDVERCFETIDKFSQLLIARIVLQNYTQYEAALLLGCGRRTVIRAFPEALDKLTAVFLDRGILKPLPNHHACQ